MLILAIFLGLLIGSPQWILALKYFPKSIRSQKTYEEKAKIGSCRPDRLFLSLVAPSLRSWHEGVSYPEMTSYVGAMALLGALFYRGRSWFILIFFILLSLGKYGPLFRLLHRFCLRIPARFLYFVGFTLAFMAPLGLSRLNLSNKWLACLVIIQCWDLIMNCSKFSPMEPWVQRWERPSGAYLTPTIALLTGTPFRVSGLPYPNTTGQIQHIRTLGYNGGGQLKMMAYFRGDKNPNGSGAHDWFKLSEDSRWLDWYGVKYAYTYRPLKEPKWKTTSIPHLYENTKVYSHTPSFKETGFEW